MSAFAPRARMHAEHLLELAEADLAAAAGPDAPTLSTIERAQVLATMALAEAVLSVSHGARSRG